MSNAGWNEFVKVAECKLRDRAQETENGTFDSAADIVSALAIPPEAQDEICMGYCGACDERHRDWESTLARERESRKQAEAALRHAASALAATGCKTKGAKEAYRMVSAALAIPQEPAERSPYECAGVCQCGECDHYVPPCNLEGIPGHDCGAEDSVCEPAERERGK